jgi:hypothetical protein
VRARQPHLQHGADAHPRSAALEQVDDVGVAAAPRLDHDVKAARILARRVGAHKQQREHHVLFVLRARRGRRRRRRRGGRAGAAGEWRGVAPPEHQKRAGEGARLLHAHARARMRLANPPGSN